MHRHVFLLTLIVLAGLFGRSPTAAADDPFKQCYQKDGGQTNTFADCTHATCSPDPNKAGGTICTCDVQTAPSVTATSVNDGKCDQPGMSTVQSRYYPIAVYQVCRKPAHWANCLGYPCLWKDGSDHKVADCKCPVEQASEYIVALPGTSCDKSVCDDKIMYSSATPRNAKKMSEYLKDKNFPGFKEPKICE